MFTTKSLCLTVCSIHEWRLFCTIFKSNHSPFTLWKTSSFVILDSWIKSDQLDVTCSIISLFNAQHVSDVNTSILRSLRFICWVVSWVVLLWFDVCCCYVVVWLGWCGICMQAEAVVGVVWYLYAGWSSASACIQIPHHTHRTRAIQPMK